MTRISKLSAKMAATKVTNKKPVFPFPLTYDYNSRSSAYFKNNSPNARLNRSPRALINPNPFKALYNPKTSEKNRLPKKNNGETREYYYCHNIGYLIT